MKHFDKMFEEMTKSLVNETSKAQKDVVSEQIDAFEQRMSKMIDDKLSSLGGQSNSEQDDSTETQAETQAETETETETENDTAN